MNSIDMSRFISPKSDQINADDLIGGPLTITVSHVSANEGSPEQPINVFFENDDGKPFRPCKSMRRVMVHIWGADASQYVGKSMTLYRDPKVQFGGMQVGGIRISHMSDIPADKMDGNGRALMSLTATRAKRAPYVVQPLKVEARIDGAKRWASNFINAIGNAVDEPALNEIVEKQKARFADLRAKRPELAAECDHALSLRRDAFAVQSDDPIEGPDDSQRGEAFADDGTGWEA